MNPETWRRLAEKGRKITRAYNSLRPIVEKAQRIQLLAEGKSLDRSDQKWTIWTHPDVPEQFKAWLKRQLADPRAREKLHRVQNSLLCGQAPQWADCLLELNAASQLIDLVQHYRDSRLKPDSRKVLVEKIERLHVKVFGRRPSNLDRVLREIGLGRFFPFRRGRPPKG